MRVAAPPRPPTGTECAPAADPAGTVEAGLVPLGDQTPDGSPGRTSGGPHPAADGPAGQDAETGPDPQRPLADPPHRRRPGRVGGRHPLVVLAGPGGDGPQVGRRPAIFALLPRPAVLPVPALVPPPAHRHRDLG